MAYNVHVFLAFPENEDVDQPDINGMVSLMYLPTVGSHIMDFVPDLQKSGCPTFKVTHVFISSDGVTIFAVFDRDTYMSESHWKEFREEMLEDPQWRSG
jgi:hypothetical protein